MLNVCNLHTLWESSLVHLRLLIWQLLLCIKHEFLDPFNSAQLVDVSHLHLFR